MTAPLRYGDSFTNVSSALTRGLSNALSNVFINNFKTIEIRTSLSPPVVMNVAELLDTTSPPSEFSKFLQPTVILTPHAGAPTVIAPYGVATNGSSLPGVALIAALVGIGFIGGWWAKSK